MTWWIPCLACHQCEATGRVDSRWEKYYGEIEKNGAGQLMNLCDTWTTWIGVRQLLKPTRTVSHRSINAVTRLASSLFRVRQSKRGPKLRDKHPQINFELLGKTGAWRLGNTPAKKKHWDQSDTSASQKLINLRLILLSYVVNYNYLTSLLMNCIPVKSRINPKLFSSKKVSEEVKQMETISNIRVRRKLGKTQ